MHMPIEFHSERLTFSYWERVPTHFPFILPLVLQTAGRTLTLISSFRYRSASQQQILGKHIPAASPSKMLSIWRMCVWVKVSAQLLSNSKGSDKVKSKRHLR